MPSRTLLHRVGVLACLLPAIASGQPRTLEPARSPLVLSLRIRDSRTGRGVTAAEVLVSTGPSAAAARAIGVRGPSASAALKPGEQVTTVRAPGYRPLATALPANDRARLAALAGKDGAVTVWLDPETAPAEIAPAALAARLRPGTALLHGHVIDAATLRPIGGVEVRLWKSGLGTLTDARGYFSLSAPGARAARTPEDAPDTDDIVFESAGYKLYRLANVALLETDTHFIVDMEPGAGETGRDDRHKLVAFLEGTPFPPQEDVPVAPAAPRPEADGLVTNAAGSAARVIDPPDSINVQGVGIVSLETYVGNGLNDEWFGSWSAQSLRAGAIAYRSYGAWYQVNRGSICATPSCQVYDTDSSVSTQQAAAYTAGILLEIGGAVARTEYSAENNCLACAAYSCVNVDLSCGHGSAGSPGAGWPCLADGHSFDTYGSPGACCFGHGRGMCQWGTQAWAGAGSNWAWTVNHYFNDLGNGTGQRTMFPTSPLTVVGADASPSSDRAGDTFNVNATGRSYAENALGQILVQVQLTGPGTVANAAGVRKVSLGARTDTAISVPFTVPANTATGTYDLVVDLWFDTNEDNAVDDPDIRLDSQRFGSKVTVTGGGTGCLGTSVPADHWRGEYWSNQDLAGASSMVRDDGTGSLAFDWADGSASAACGIGTDLFSARWTRTVSFAAGTYRFTVTSDDGFRFFVDGAVRLDKWVLQAPTTYAVDVTLGAGNHALRLDWFENAGGAVAKLSWQAVANPCVVAVAADHWRGEYWNNKDLAGASAMVRDDGTGPLAFDWGAGSPNSACGLGNDLYSARWTRTVSVAAGTYRFTVTSDDGFRLFVDGAVQLDKWVVQAPTTYTVDVALGAGDHALRLDWFENAGGAVARLSWQSVTTPCVASVAADHWRGEYWNNKDLAGASAMVRDDGTGSLAFDWGTGSPNAGCGLGVDLFSARWTRTATFAAGTYRFTVTSDDGFRLFVDGALQLDKWILQGPTTYTVDVPLGAGSHALRLDWFENTGGAVARLSWQSLSAAAPVVDSASVSGGNTADLAWAHTVSGNNRLLLVGAAIRGNVPIASVTYAGLPLTKIRHDTFGTDVRSELWYLVAPPLGTANVQVHMSGSQNVIAGATSWTNVNQSNPLGNNAGANNGSTVPGTTTAVDLASAPDQRVVDVVATQAAGARATAAAAQMVHWYNPGTAGYGAASSIVGAATTRLTWTLAYAEFWAQSAVALRGAQ
jgi:hypothetical protein